MARQKCLYLRHQGEFQHNYFNFVSLHHSNHDGVVRIFVGHSEVVKRLLFKLHYAAQFFPYQECNIIYAAQFFPYQECNKSHQKTHHKLWSKVSPLDWLTCKKVVNSLSLGTRPFAQGAERVWDHLTFELSPGQNVDLRIRSVDCE